MKTANLILLAVIIGLVSAHGLKHECHHDKISTYIKQEVKEVDMEEHERHMQTTATRKFKITYDISFLNSLAVSTANTAFKANVEKAIKIAIQFFSDLITIVPRSKYMIWDMLTTKCGFATIPATDKVLGRDSDLHLYITYSNEPQSTYLAYAGWCRLLRGIGATHGQVNFNLGLLATYTFSDPFQFQSLMQIVIHEMTHVLGFSGSDIQYWVDANKKAYTAPTTSASIRGLPTTLLATPNVLAYARTYYACTTLAGMALENQGSSGSLGSHWETTVINAEMMNASISLTQSSYSPFTTALLRDTGYYAAVSTLLEEPVTHGKNGGCAFVTGACNPTVNKEFCTAGAKQICDPNGYSVSSCSTTTFTDAGCNIPLSYSNGKCYQAATNFQNTSSYVQYLGVGFGNNSRCFMSNVTNNSGVAVASQGLCYNYTCDTAGTTLTASVAGKSFVCNTNGKVITGIAGTFGTFYCPNNIQNFCKAKGFCPNQCSSNGLCQNGVCHCVTGFKGTDCSVVG